MQEACLLANCQFYWLLHPNMCYHLIWQILNGSANFTRTNKTTPNILIPNFSFEWLCRFVCLWFTFPLVNIFYFHTKYFLKLIRSHCDFDGCISVSDLQTFSVNILICSWLLNYSEKTDWNKIYWWLEDSNMCFCFFES